MLNLFTLGIIYFKKNKLYISLSLILVAVLFSYSYSIAQTNTVYISDCGVLNQADTEYILQNNVSSDGTCFSVQANNIKLNLNGYTVTYSNGPNTSVSNGDFESGSGGSASSWDQSSGPNFQRATGTFVDPISLWSGSYAMNINLPASNQSIVSQSPVTIPANRTYAVSAMIRNVGGSGVSAYIQTEDASGNVLGKTSISSSGPFSYNFVEFSAGSDTNVYIRLGVEGTTASQSGTVYFDDVRVQPIANHGVVTATCTAYHLYDNSCGGSAANLQVTNGSIVQGSANAYLGHAIDLKQGPNSSGAQIDNLNITVSGPNSVAINTTYKSNMNIHHNTIYNNVSVIVNRHSIDGATIRLYDSSNNNQVHDNTIIGGPQGGIMFARGSGSSAYNNTIRQNGRYSNDFAIYAYNDNMSVYGNTVDATSGRGIHVNGNYIDVYNNIISVRELKQNQEYNGCELGGAYGIQLEGGHTSNNNIHDNTVTAYADQCDGLAFRATEVTLSNNQVYNNSFTAVRVGNTTAKAAGASFGGNTGLINIHDNTFTADSYLVHLYWDGSTGTLFDSNIFRYGNNQASNKYTFFFDTSGGVDFTFRDNSFESGTSNTSLYSHSLTGWAGPMSYTMEWTLNLRVENSAGSPVSGASVSINNSNGQNEFSGTTNSNGNIETALTQFENHNTTSQSSQIDYFTPHSIVVSAPGYDPVMVSLNMNETKNLTINIENGESSEGQVQTISCTTSWNCTSWSSCVNSNQTRTCTDANSCGDNTNKPSESQSCSVTSSTPDTTSNPSTNTGSPNTSNNNTPSIPTSNSNGGELACKNCTYVRGSLLVLENVSGAAVYHIGKDGKKYIFPDAKTYFTWNRDFVNVKKVPLSVLDDYPDGGAVAYRGGTKLITHQNTARVYAVEPGGIIRWIPSETIARNLFGDNWQQKVQDVIPGFFAISYTRGEDLSDKLPTGTLIKNGENYYYIDGNTKRKFDSLSVLAANGFKIEDAINVTDLSKYSSGINISDFDEDVANYL